MKDKSKRTSRSNQTAKLYNFQDALLTCKRTPQFKLPASINTPIINSKTNTNVIPITYVKRKVSLSDQVPFKEKFPKTYKLIRSIRPDTTGIDYEQCIEYKKAIARIALDIDNHAYVWFSDCNSILGLCLWELTEQGSDYWLILAVALRKRSIKRS